MPKETPTTPEINKGIDDNDRKFIVETINPEFLAAHDAKSYYMTTDWIETNEDTETKIVRKEFENGDIQLLHIAKVTVNGDRKSDKSPITESEYAKQLNLSMPHVEKRRYEFKLLQNGIWFKIKYDEFVNSELRILEVDADTEEQRNKFDPKAFAYGLAEVTGQRQFYGYRVAGFIQMNSEA